MAKSVDYWAQRALEREAEYSGGSEETIATMQKVYERAFDNIQKQIQSSARQLIKKGGLASSARDPQRPASASEDAEHYLDA